MFSLFRKRNVEPMTIIKEEKMSIQENDPEEEVIDNLSLHLAFEGYDNNFIHHLVYEIGLDKETKEYNLNLIHDYSNAYKYIKCFKEEKIGSGVVVFIFEFSNKDRYEIGFMLAFFKETFDLLDCCMVESGPSLLANKDLLMINNNQIQLAIIK